MNIKKYEKSLMISTLITFGYVGGYFLGNIYGSDLKWYLITSLSFLAYITIAYYIFPNMNPIQESEGGTEQK